MGALPSSASRGVAWESTIFFAPELRGRGLLPVAFCHQTHLAQILPAGTELVSSIGDWNERSIHAHQVWAEVCGWEAAWEAAWEVVCEEVRGRVAHVLRWPSARPIPHPCHQRRLTAEPSADDAVTARYQRAWLTGLRAGFPIQRRPPIVLEGFAAAIPLALFLARLPVSRTRSVRAVPRSGAARSRLNPPDPLAVC